MKVKGDRTLLSVDYLRVQRGIAISFKETPL